MVAQQEAPSVSRAGRAHRGVLAAFRVVARPFVGTQLGTSITRHVPFARDVYYGLYSRVSHTRIDVATPSGMLTVDLTDRSVAQKLYLGCAYEPKEYELLSRLLEPGMTFFDVGAHVGYYTLLASKRVGAGGRVVAFEPDTRNFQLLTENVRSNGLTNVEPVNMAVGSHDGDLQLYRDPDYAGDHRIHAIAGRASITVRCTTLDAFCSGGSGPDVMKMDVQGAEGEVLAGMMRLLREAPPRAIVAEYWPAELASVGTDPQQLVDGVLASGYTVYNVPDESAAVRVDDVAALVRSLPGAQDYTNLLFVRNDSLPGWLP